MGQDLFLDDEQMEAVNQKLQQEEQREKTIEAVERLGKVIPGLGKGVEPNSPAAMLTGAGA